MAREYPIEKVRDIGIIAHIDAGKTTVSERILFYTGVAHKIGEVHEGSTVMDWMEQERERGITITSAATTCFWTPTYANGDKAFIHRINLIDTPGHIDFTVEVKRSMRVLDGAVVVFDGVSGVEPQSETNWHYADDYHVPRICFINKLDRMGASFENSFKSILEKLNPNAVAIQIPMGTEGDFNGIIDLIKMKAYYFDGERGEKIREEEIPAEYLEEAKTHRKALLERVVEQDDAMMTDFFDGKEIPIEKIKSTLRKACLEIKLIPVVTGSALKNKGVQLVLDAVIDYLPSPADIPKTIGHDPETDAEIERRPLDTEPFSSLAFKVAADPFVGSLTYFRVYSGSFKKGNYLLNTTKGNKERIGRILRMHANHREDVDEIFTGEIGGLVGLKDTTTGDTLCDPEHPIVLEKIDFPEPVISLRVEPKTKADQEKMGMALRRLAEEDPTLRLSGNSETGETIIAGMGELHLEITVDRMKREFGVEANVGRPQVAYRETIRGNAEAEGKYIRQSGGRGQYGHVWLKVESQDTGAGFEFVDAIKGGSIPKEFIPAVEKGIKETLENGVLAGYPMVDIKVTLFDGSFHEVDSGEAAFKIAGSMAFKEGCRNAKPVILEPIMSIQVTVPTEFMGDITGDISSKRGLIESIEDKMNVKVVNGKVPLAEMFGYATNLRSITQGRGHFSMTFSNYEAVPSSVAEKIIEGKKK